MQLSQDNLFSILNRLQPGQPRNQRVPLFARRDGSLLHSEQNGIYVLPALLVSIGDGIFRIVKKLKHEADHLSSA
jgi:hypothetical protein